MEKTNHEEVCGEGEDVENALLPMRSTANNNMTTVTTAL